MGKIKESYGWDQGATRDVGDLFLRELSKTLAVGSCPGHHNAVLIVEENPRAWTLKMRGGCDRDCYGKRAGKGALIQTELSGTLGASQDQTLFAYEKNTNRKTIL